MSNRDEDIAWVIARLTREHQEENARIASVFMDMEKVWEPPIMVWDVNDPAILAKVCDGFELQMMGIRP